MLDSLSNLIAEVDQRLGHPAIELLHPEDVVSIAIEVLTRRGLISQQSQYARISKKKLIYPATRDTRLSMVPDMMMPSYLERQLASGPTDIWTYVSSAGDAEIEGARTHGDGARCSFTQEPDGFHLILSYDPIGMVHRLSYYAERQIAQAMGDALDRGSRFGFLYTHETIEGCVALIMANAPEDRPLSSTYLQALSATLAYSQAQIAKWSELFDNEKDANRNPRARNRRKILGRGGMRRTTY